jgi:hypothetical protein
VEEDSGRRIVGRESELAIMQAFLAGDPPPRTLVLTGTMRRTRPSKTAIGLAP